MFRGTRNFSQNLRKGALTLFSNCTSSNNDPTFVKNAPPAATPPRDSRQSRSNLCCRPVHLADPGRIQRFSEPYHVLEYSVRSGSRPFPHRPPLRTQDQNPLVKDFLAALVLVRCLPRSKSNLQLGTTQIA